MKHIDTAVIQEAVKALHHGDVIAYPTEAMYGLGCDPFNANAIAKILQLKHRSIDQGFILVAEHWDQIESLVQPIEPAALYQALDTWPGPTTWVFPASPLVPQWIRGNHSGIAIRISDHPIVKMLSKTFGGPIVSTSANLHGQPPIRDYRMMKMTFGDQLDLIIEGHIGSQTQPTTIKNAVTGEVIR